MPKPSRLVVLVSGTGSNLQALLEASRTPDFGAEVVAVGADRSGIRALDIAAAEGVPSFVRRVSDFDDRAAWNVALADEVSTYAPDLVICAGFMRLLGPEFLSRFAGRVINTHPALLPAFPGAHGVRDALAYGVRVTGCTLFIVDEGVDTGPIVAQAAVEVWPDDDEAALHERIKTHERALLVQTVGQLARSGWTVTDRKVTLS